MGGQVRIKNNLQKKRKNVFMYEIGNWKIQHVKKYINKKV